MGKIDVVYIGPPKSGSTWLHQCFKEHPEISVPKIDSTHYYSIYYSLKNKKWFNSLFKKAKKNQIKVDMCQDYLTCSSVPKRIYKENPNAKIICCLREPIDRAFSHYWHLKKKNVINYEFSNILKNYDLFKTWIETGFYAQHLKLYFELFSKENILVLWFDDLKKNPKKFLKKVFDFLGVEGDFKPSVLNTRMNVAGYKRNSSLKFLLKIGKFMKNSRLSKFYFWLKNKKMDSAIKSKVSDKKQYTKGVNPELRKKLLKITVPEIKKLEKMLGVSLKDWKNY